MAFTLAWGVGGRRGARGFARGAVFGVDIGRVVGYVEGPISTRVEHGLSARVCNLRRNVCDI